MILPKAYFANEIVDFDKHSGNRAIVRSISTSPAESASIPSKRRLRQSIIGFKRGLARIWERDLWLSKTLQGKTSVTIGIPGILVQFALESRVSIGGWSPDCRRDTVEGAQ
jgi:hypothetical protein